ncbi:MAG: hypothetical protein IJR86_05080 [Bacteroidaceae bacterium]|jgi:hypothetical protein|nr:hypothetical protein [Bacteroidaceae bacterium]
MEETTKKRGGKREGAGRKATVGNVKSIALRIPQDVAAILDKVEHRSKFICEAIRLKAKQDGLDGV